LKRRPEEADHRVVGGAPTQAPNIGGAIRASFGHGLDTEGQVRAAPEPAQRARRGRLQARARRARRSARKVIAARADGGPEGGQQQRHPLCEAGGPTGASDWEALLKTMNNTTLASGAAAPAEGEVSGCVPSDTRAASSVLARA
jgi:hypothetical protein